MNIFYDYEGFYGETEAVNLCRQSNELLKLTQSIRQQLGNQGYLLDHYLSMVLEGLMPKLRPCGFVQNLPEN